jgi:DNA primase
MTEEEAEEYIKSNPQFYFEKARKTGYVCPLCQNGKGNDGTGIKEIPGNKGHFKCGESGDVFDFIGKEHGLTSFPDILEKAFSIYGIIVEKGKYKKKEWKPKMESETKEQTADKNAKDAVIDYQNFCKEANEKLNEDYKLKKTNYLKERGISIETQNKFNIGYVKDWVSPTAERNGKNRYNRQV